MFSDKLTLIAIRYKANVLVRFSQSYGDTKCRTLNKGDRGLISQKKATNETENRCAKLIRNHNNK